MIKDKDKFFFKSNFDVEMTTDILLERKGVDELILFSGDSDFHNLVVKLKNFGIKVTVFSTRRMISWELKLSASKYVFLEDIRKDVDKKTSAQRRSSVKLVKIYQKEKRKSRSNIRS